MLRHDLLSRGLVSGAVLAVVLGYAAGPASAEVNLYEQGGLKIDGALTAGVAGFTNAGGQFGHGSYSAAPSSRRLSDRMSWSELFLTPEVKVSYATLSSGTLYADVSAQLSATGGDGDASVTSTTYGHPVLLELENAYAGWRSGKTLTGLGLDEDGLDLSGGRQSFRVADGFLISNGVNNLGQRGNFWFQSRTAFAQTGLAKISSGPVRGDVFYLQNESAQSVVEPSGAEFAKTKVIGANIEYFETLDKEEGGAERNGAANFADRKWYAGVTYFNVISAFDDGLYRFGKGKTNADVTNTLTSNREGMNVFSAHIGGNIVPVVPDFSLYGNYVYETNGGSRKVDASAWYIEPGYQFSNVLWTPKLSYRYAHFSGDGDTSNTKKTAYDPFFYNAISRGYGTWILGEIVGNYVVANSNVNVHMLTLSVNPRDDLKLSLLGYVYNYDKRTQYSSNISSDSVAQELDLTAEWTINEHLSLSAAVAAATPGNGYTQFLQAGNNGNWDQTWYLGEAALVVKF